MLSGILHSPILLLHARRMFNGVPCGRGLCSARRDNYPLVTWGMRMLVDWGRSVSALSGEQRWWQWMRQGLVDESQGADR
jgi:hypothetical protein